MKIVCTFCADVIILGQHLSGVFERNIGHRGSRPAQVVDERPAPRLEFSIATPEESTEETSTEIEGSADLPEALAEALKGTVWDSDNERNTCSSR